MGTLRVLLSSFTELQLLMSLCRAFKVVQCRSLPRARARRTRYSLQGASLRGSPAARVLVTAHWQWPVPTVGQGATGRLRRPEGGRRREPAPSPGAGTLRGDQAEAGDRPGGFGYQGTPVVAASVRRKAKGPAGGALEWPHVNLKGPVQSESGRAPVPIARRSTAQQLAAHAHTAHGPTTSARSRIRLN